MPDEIGWLTPEQEAVLDRVAAEIAKDGLPTEAEDAELARDCAAARRFRVRQEQREKNAKKKGG